MPTLDTPVTEKNRLAFLDILRGLAVLAIFAVNIKAMTMPIPYYGNASLWPGDYDRWVAALQAFLIDDKWRSIFTGLFGVGIALIARRAKDRGAQSLTLLSRRLAFLGAFGLAHIAFIWLGDILFIYAFCGFLALRFRHSSARHLLFWGALCLGAGFLWTSVFNAAPAFLPELNAELEPILWGTDAVALGEARSSMLGGVFEQIATRIRSTREYLLIYYLAGGHWLETLGVMLAGMWAFRIGFFSLSLAASTYRNAAVIGLALAFALDAIRWTLLHFYSWDFGVYSYLESINALNGYAGAVGYAGLTALLVKNGWAPRAVAATGRMAFSNYIVCSLIGTTIANGHGLALYGSFTNLQLALIVLATWAAILVWSPLWLSRFRFGPLEWVWRSLTYGRMQTFRQKPSAAGLQPTA